MNQTGSLSELDIEGQKLLRMVVKAYFPLSYSVLVSAFLHCAPDTRKINESKIAEYMQLNPDQIATMLTKLSQCMLIAHENVTEEKPKEPGAKIDRRPRMLHQWSVDYETLVNAVRYKHTQMHQKLDQPVQSVTYWCSNPGCYQYHKAIELEDVIAGQHARKMFGAKTMDSHAAEQLTRLNTGTRGIAAAQVKRPRYGNPTRPGGITVRLSEKGAVVRADTPITPATAASTSVLTAQVQENKSEFNCRICDEHLSEVSSSSGKLLADLKRRFNQQTSHISTQLELVAALLKEKRALEAANLEGQGKGDSAVVGVGARGGCSSATELASRSERRQQSLAWESQTEAERAAHAEEDARRKRREADAVLLRAREEEERENELFKAKLQREAREREEEARIAVAVFGEGAVVGTTGGETASTGTGTGTGDISDFSMDGVHVEQPLLDDVWDTDDLFGPSEPTVANADAVVYVRGVEKRVGEVTDQDLADMTDEELARYQELAIE